MQTITCSFAQSHMLGYVGTCPENIDVSSGTGERGTNRGPDSPIPVVVGPVYGESNLFVESQVNALPSDRQRQQDI